MRNESEITVPVFMSQNIYKPTMKKVRLELTSFRILKKKEKWNIYFVLYMNDPEKPDKTVIRSEPSNTTLPLNRYNDNFYRFGNPDESGLGIVHVPVPASGHLDIRLKIMHSRSKTRNTGERMEQISGALKPSQMEVIFLSRFKWYLVNVAVETVERILKNVKDRELGFLSLDMDFSTFGKDETEREITKKVSTGFAEITWKWKIIG